MELIADFHVHSRFARACSKQLTLPMMAAWAAVKGIDLMGTADFTHPSWLGEIRTQLEEAGDGIYALKKKYTQPLPYHVADSKPVRFVLSHEVATIWSQDGKLRRMHTILVAPSLEAVIKLTKVLTPLGKLGADGRPILGMSARALAEHAWSVDERMLVIPAHAWTPWFAVFGSQSGFDSLEQCFGDLSSRIYAIETGMSSDPQMNWRISALDQVALISCSDGHSPDNLGREATVFQLEDELSFDLLAQMIREGAPARASQRSIKNFLARTIEFFPEEGKYHYDGHRVCGVCWSPSERQRHSGICSSCGQPVTVGVASRIDDLADRPIGFRPDGVPPYLSIVPIRDIASAWLGVGKGTKRVDALYRSLVTAHGPEFHVLLKTPIAEIAKTVGEPFAALIEGMRTGAVTMTPGYDGVYGKLVLPEQIQMSQRSLFQETA